MTVTAFAADAIAPGDLALDRAAALLLDGPPTPAQSRDSLPVTPGTRSPCTPWPVAFHRATGWDACP